MIGPCSPCSLTTLAFSLAIATAPLHAQKNGDRLGVYDNWSVRVLRYDKIRFYYAETKFSPSQSAEPQFSDLRLQVASRSLSGESDVVRFTRESASFDKEICVTIDSTLACEANPFASMDFGDSSVVDYMRARETATGEIVLKRNDTDSTSVGVFSLRGFTAAYNAIEKQCTNPPTKRASPQSISVSDISVVDGSPPYAEFSVTGPFFQNQRSDRIKIRVVQSESATDEGFWNLADIDPRSFFSYGGVRLEVYHEGALVFAESYNRLVDLQRACLDPDSGRLKIVIRWWSGGASSPGYTMVLYDDPSEGIVSELVAKHEGGVTLFHCSDGESSWQWDRHFLPCQCVGRATNTDYYSVIDDVVREIDRYNIDRPGDVRIDTDAFSALVSRISRLEPFTRWDGDSSLDLQRFESSKFTVALITYYDHANVYNNVQTTFVRRRTDDFWVPVHGAHTFYAVEIHGFVDEEKLDISMCDDCSRWRGYDRISRNAGEWLTVVENCRGWYKNEYFYNASIDEVKTCLDEGVDANTTNTSGFTPLHQAARYSGNPEVITALIDAGADTEAQDEYKSTPLHYAAQFNSNSAVVKALIEAGANLAARNTVGNAPLDLAVQHNDNPVVANVLREAGVPQRKQKR